MDKKILHILGRLKEHFGYKTDSDVAEALEMTKTALSNHKTRRTIPYEALSTFCDKEKISMDWILTGEGPIERGGYSTAEEQAPYRRSEAARRELLKKIMVRMDKRIKEWRIDMTPEEKAELALIIYDKKIKAKQEGNEAPDTVDHVLAAFKR